MLTTIKRLVRTVVPRPLPRGFLLRRMPRGAVCAEIGVYAGAFSAQILRDTQPRSLHLIDPWRFHDDPVYEGSLYGGPAGRNQQQMDAIHQQVRQRFAVEIAAGRVHLHRCDSIAAATCFADAHFDWIYIDGNHLYPFVKADLEAYYPKVKPGGLIAGDDYAREGWWADGVTRAVDEFLATRRCRRVLIREHQYILRKP